MKVLVERRFISSREVHDVIKLPSKDITRADVAELVDRFGKDGWLMRDARGFWELGPRSFLEMSAHISDLVAALEENESSSAAHLKASDLPQIIMY